MDIIEIIKDEMVCANACPMFNDSHYDIEKCNCYKKQVIDRITELEGAINQAIDKIELWGNVTQAQEILAKVAKEDDNG